VAEDLHRIIPNRFRAAAVKRRSATIQEEFTVRRALRQAQGLPWHGTSRWRPTTTPTADLPVEDNTLLNALVSTNTSRLMTTNRHSCRPTVHLQSKTSNSRVINQRVRDSDAVVGDPSALTTIACINDLRLSGFAPSNSGDGISRGAVVAWFPLPCLFLTGELADSVKFGLAHHCHINVHCRRPFSGIRLSPNFLSFNHFSLNMELLWQIRHCVVVERAKRARGQEGRPRRA